jgi:hypothetical protein
MSSCGCPCGVCADGYHIFCNRRPHGDPSEAERWFREHPDVAKQIQARSTEGKATLDRALRQIAEDEAQAEEA